MSTLDLLYIVLAGCVIIITVLVVLLGLQAIELMQDMKRTAQNIEQITALIEGVAQVVFPSMERSAKSADQASKLISSFIEKKFSQLTHKK